MVGHNVNESRTTKVISARIKYPLYKKIQELADDKFTDKSKFIENAIIFYMDSLEDIEKSNALKHILRHKKDYKDIREELSVIDIENQRVSTDMMRKTYAKFVDKALANVFIANKPYNLTEKEMKKVLVDHLESHRPRARYYECEELIDLRQEDPINYASSMLDHMKAENQLDEDMGDLTSRLSG